MELELNVGLFFQYHMTLKLKLKDKQIRQTILLIIQWLQMQLDKKDHDYVVIFFLI